MLSRDDQQLQGGSRDVLESIAERRQVWEMIALKCVDMREEEAAVEAIRLACMDDPPCDWPAGSRGEAIRNGTASIVSLSRAWKIAVCPHGHRVEYRERVDRWQHMDSDAEFCDQSERQVIEVIAAPEPPRYANHCTCPCGRGTNPSCPVHP